MPGTGLFDQVRPLFRESEQELDCGAWVVDAADREVIACLLPALDALAQQRADHPATDRSPQVRDAIADLAPCAAQASGRLARLLLGATRALEPVVPREPRLHIPAPAARTGPTEAEHVLLRLRTVLRLAHAHQVVRP